MSRQRPTQTKTKCAGLQKRLHAMSTAHSCVVIMLGVAGFSSFGALGDSLGTTIDGQATADELALAAASTPTLSSASQAAIGALDDVARLAKQAAGMADEPASVATDGRRFYQNVPLRSYAKAMRSDTTATWKTVIENLKATPVGDVDTQLFPLNSFFDRDLARLTSAALREVREAIGEETFQAIEPIAQVVGQKPSAERQVLDALRSFAEGRKSKARAALEQAQKRNALPDATAERIARLIDIYDGGIETTVRDRVFGRRVTMPDSIRRFYPDEVPGDVELSVETAQELFSRGRYGAIVRAVQEGDSDPAAILSRRRVKPVEDFARQSQLSEARNADRLVIAALLDIRETLGAEEFAAAENLFFPGPAPSSLSRAESATQAVGQLGANEADVMKAFDVAQSKLPEGLYKRLRTLSEIFGGVGLTEVAIDRVFGSPVRNFNSAQPVDMKKALDDFLGRKGTEAVSKLGALPRVREEAVDGDFFARVRSGQSDGLPDEYLSFLRDIVAQKNRPRPRSSYDPADVEKILEAASQRATLGRVDEVKGLRLLLEEASDDAERVRKVGEQLEAFAKRFEAGRQADLQPNTKRTMQENKSLDELREMLGE